MNTVVKPPDGLKMATKQLVHPRGGPGVTAQQVRSQRRWREYVLAAVTESDLGSVWETLTLKAMSGDTTAIVLYLQYVIGKHDQDFSGVADEVQEKEVPLHRAAMMVKGNAALIDILKRRDRETNASS